MWREKYTHTLLVEPHISASILASHMEISQKLGMEPPHDLAIPILGTYSQVVKSADQQGYNYINVYSNTNQSSQDIEWIVKCGIQTQKSVTLS